MSIGGRVFGGPQASTPCTSFSDTFVGVAQQTWGPNWCVLVSAAGLCTGQTVWQSHWIFNHLARLKHVSGAPGNATFCVAWIPRALMEQSCIDGHSQFSEVTIATETSIAGNTNQYGVSCMLQPMQALPAVISLTPGYDAWVTPGTSGLAIVRNNTIGATTSSILASNVTAFGAGTTLRMEVVVTSSANTITVYRNGVAVLAVVDNSASRHTRGYPGINCRFLSVTDITPNNPATTEFSLYNGGPL